MVGNFKLLMILLYCLSCKNIETQKANIIKEAINENIGVLIENPQYFDIENKEDTVYLSKSIVRMNNYDEIKNIFSNRFNLHNNDLQPILLNLNVIPISDVNGYKVSLIEDTQYLDNKITFQFANAFINEDMNYFCIEVISQHGIGSKFMLYLFRKDKSKWLLVEKKLIAIG